MVGNSVGYDFNQFITEQLNAINKNIDIQSDSYNDLIKASEMCPEQCAGDIRSLMNKHRSFMDAYSEIAKQTILALTEMKRYSEVCGDD